MQQFAHPGVKGLGVQLKCCLQAAPVVPASAVAPARARPETQWFFNQLGCTAELMYMLWFDSAGCSACRHSKAMMGWAAQPG